MWARVKGKTENAIARLPFKATYMFRPGYIQPVHGEKSRTAWTRNTYLLAGWLYPLWKLLFPNHVSTTESARARDAGGRQARHRQARPRGPRHQPRRGRLSRRRILTRHQEAS